MDFEKETMINMQYQVINYFLTEKERKDLFDG